MSLLPSTRHPCHLSSIYRGRPCPYHLPQVFWLSYPGILASKKAWRNSAAFSDQLQILRGWTSCRLIRFLVLKHQPLDVHFSQDTQPQAFLSWFSRTVRPVDLWLPAQHGVGCHQAVLDQWWQNVRPKVDVLLVPQQSLFCNFQGSHFGPWVFAVFRKMVSPYDRYKWNDMGLLKMVKNKGGFTGFVIIPRSGVMGLTYKLILHGPPYTQYFILKKHLISSSLPKSSKYLPRRCLDPLKAFSLTRCLED